MSQDYDVATQAVGTEPEKQSTGELVSRLSQDMSQLVRDEMRLAQAELTEKGKRAGIGAGMFGAAGLLALYGVGVLIATVVLALALAMPAWLATLIVAVVLLAAAGAVALMGKKQVTQAVPPVPERTVENVKRDVQAVKHG